LPRSATSYHVEVDDIKRANHLYTTDTIHTKTELLIPTNDHNFDMGEHVQLDDIKKRDAALACDKRYVPFAPPAGPMMPMPWYLPVRATANFTHSASLCR
jgi:LysM repeat protein